MEVNPYVEQSVLRDTDVLFRAVLSVAAAEIRQPLMAAFATWREVPGLEGMSSAVARLQRGRPKSRARVETGPRIQAFMKERFPEFAQQFNGPGFQRYSLP